MANQVARNKKLARLAARRYGIPVDLFMRQIRQESGFRNLGANSAGAVGVAQIVPKWHPGVNASNPRQALMYAARLMKSHYKKYGSWRDALSAYNSGGPWSSGQGIEETRNYVKIILGNRKYGKPGKGGKVKGMQVGTPRQPSQVIPGLNLPAIHTGLDPGRRQILSNLFNDVGLPDIFSGTSPTLPGIRIPDMVIPGKPGKPGRPRQQQQQGGPRGPGNVKKNLPGAKGQRRAINQARRMGLSVSENPLVDHVDPVHVSGSDHYKTYKGTNVGHATDVSGSPQQLRKYFKWLERNRKRLHIKDVFYDPMGYSWDEGKRMNHTIGGHGTHVHVSTF